MTYKYELNQYQYKENIRRNLSDAHQVDSTWLHCFHVFPMGNTHSKTKSNWIILQIDVAWSLCYIWLIWHTIQIDDTLPAGDFQVTHDEQTFQKKRTRCKFIEYFDFHIDMFDFVFVHWKQINPKHSKFPIINKTWVFFHFGRLDVTYP